MAKFMSSKTQQDLEVEITFRPPYNAVSTGSLPENIAIGTVVADLTATGGVPDYVPVTFSEAGDPDSKFTVTGATLVVSSALNFDVATSHSVTVRASNVTGNSPDVTVVVAVTDIGAPGGLIVPDQTMRFGVLTKALAGVWHPEITSVGVAISDAQITGGTANDGFWIAETDGGLKRSRDGTVALPPPSGTLTMLYNGVETATITVQPISNMYHFATQAEVLVLLGLNAATGAGKTYEGRPGVYGQLNFNSKTFATRCTLQGPEVWPPVVAFRGQSSVSTAFITQCHNITFRYLEIQNTYYHNSAAGNGEAQCLIVSGSLVPHDIIIEKCFFHGIYYDPLSDVWETTAYRNTAGISSSKSSKDLTIRQCLFQDLWRPMSVIAQGFTVIEDNVFDRIYYDQLGCAFYELSTKWRSARNIFTRHMGRGTDKSQPHVDNFQMIHAETYGQNDNEVPAMPAGTTVDLYWSGLEIEQNIVYLGNARGETGHGFNIQHPIKTEVPANDPDLILPTTIRHFCDDPLIAGNVFILSDNSYGIVIPRIRNGRIYQNTVIHMDRAVPQTTAPGIRIADGFPYASVNPCEGTPKVYGNIGDVVSLHPNCDASRNIVTNGSDASGYGPRIDLDLVFEGLDHTNPMNRDEVFARFSMKLSGVADLDNSGSGTVGDAGAIGSGYQTFPTSELNPTGYSKNTAYEVP